MQLPTPVATLHHAAYPAISPTKPSLSQRGKVVLVTGGGSGLGVAVARAFAEAGAAHVALLGRTASTLSAAASSISAAFPSTKIHEFQADITSASAVERAFSSLQSAAGAPVDVVVANAGYFTAGPIATLSEEDFKRGNDINIWGTLNTAQALLRHSAKGATFIHVSTAAAHAPFMMRGFGGYVVSKAGAARLVEMLAGEHPELRVFNMHPGGVKTAMAEKSGMTEMCDDDDGLPAAVAVWMASPEAEWLRGRFIWSNWDLDELKKEVGKRVEEQNDYLTVGLRGWPFDGKTAALKFESQ